MNIFDAILIVCIPVALYGGFLSGWALGRRMSRTDDILMTSKDEELALRAQEEWARHWWRATREAEKNARLCAEQQNAIQPDANGDLRVRWMNVDYDI
jgi:hypothetical protein